MTSFAVALGPQTIVVGDDGATRTWATITVALVDDWTPPPGTPGQLDFSDANNSGLIAAVMEDI